LNRYGFAFFRFTAGCFPIFFNISLKAEYTKKETSGFTGLLRSTKFVGYSKQYKVKILNKIRKYVILKTVRTIERLKSVRSIVHRYRENSNK